MSASAIKTAACFFIMAIPYHAARRSPSEEFARGRQQWLSSHKAVLYEREPHFGALLDAVSEPAAPADYCSTQ